MGIPVQRGGPRPRAGSALSLPAWRLEDSVKEYIAGR